MSQSISYQQTLTVGGLSLSVAEVPDGDVAPDVSLTVTGGGTGELTTRTSDTQGSVTMDSGSHGISTGNKVDVYWDGGMRYAMTVGTVAGAVVPLTSSGTGDVLPAADTALVLKVPQSVVVVVEGDDLTVIGFKVPFGVRGVAVVVDDAAADALLVPLDGTNDYIWTDTQGTTNPLAGDTVGSVRFSTESTSDQEVKAVFVY
jgi:hypothetical protein